VKVGDIVRSYDFPHNNNIYVEGIIRKIAPWRHCGCSLNHIHIEVTLDTFIPTDPTEEDLGDIRDWVFPVHPEEDETPFGRHRIIVLNEG